MSKYDLGIIGGMGSMATAELFKRIISRTEYKCDQDHMKICVLNNSIIPDRTNCIINNGESPVPYINESIRDLVNLGVDSFIIPCNTAHYFANQFDINGIRFISMIEETLLKITEKYKNKKVCILATYGTIKSKVYHNHKLSSNIDFVYANEEEQKKVMDVILYTKSDLHINENGKTLDEVMKAITEREGNCLFVLACTELSLYLNYLYAKHQVIDAMDCLVEAAILKNGYKIKE